MSPHPTIAIHGGAWAIPKHLWSESIDGVKEAAKCGYEVLLSGQSSLDAVEVAVISLEDNPCFDAGKGSVLTYEGQVEMDAMIMEGHYMKAGSVAAIRNIQNPISVARKVLENTHHVLVVGEGANKFASLQGIPEVAIDQIVTKEAKEELEKFKKFKTTVDCLFNNKEGHDTVGCVALDGKNHVACGTSTGGITAKLPGRVGDSPLLGCGGIADDEIGAVSATGHGEAIMKVCLSKTVLSKIATGTGVSDSINGALKYMERRVGGYGGAIALSSSGDVGIGFTTEKMAWAYIKNNELHYGLHAEQHEVEYL